MFANKSPCTVGLYVSIALALVFGAPVWLAVHLAPDDGPRWVEVRHIDTAARAVDLFKSRGFDAETAGEPEIPPVFLATLPGDLKSVEDIGRRKALFVSIVLPHVLRANQQLLKDRSRLERLHRDIRAERRLSGRDRRWLATLANIYRTRPMDTGELLRRVDIVPPRLAVAQAVQESGWGTSRFARKGNALFGQHALQAGGGMVAADNASVSLEAFDTLRYSVRAYMRNLNRNRAYRDFRTMRAGMRAAGGKVDAMALANSLRRYSEEGALYVERLRTVMSMPEVAAAKDARLLK